MTELDKHRFKICEAVALGLTHYYLDSDKDRREITDADIIKAGIIIPTLPKGWMQQKHCWDTCRH